MSISPIEIKSTTSHGSGSMSGDYYKIEIRTSYPEPVVLGEGQRTFVIDNAWREWPITSADCPHPMAVPVKSYEAEAVSHGVVPYIAAEAHRWMLLAYLDAIRITGALCIETRLVKIQYKRSYELNEVGVSEPLVEVSRNKVDFAVRPIEKAESATKAA